MGKRRVVWTRVGVALCAVVVMVTHAAPAAPRSVRGLRIPAGYRVMHRSLARGVDHFTLVRSRKVVVNVARIAPDAPVRVQPVLARRRLAGPGSLATTSEMCRRVRCLAAINGDFFSTKGVPVGGVIVNGEPIRSARSARPHVVLAGAPQIRQPLSLGISLVARYPMRVLDVTVNEEHRPIALHGLNVERPRNTLVLYTPRYGSRTRTRGSGVELVLRGGRLSTTRSTPARMLSLRRGANTAIPRDGYVLSGTGEGARILTQLWNDVRARDALADAWISVAAGGATQAIAGKPVILRDGKDAYPGKGGAKQPMSIVGWTKKGELLLVVIDGRRRGHSWGMSYREAASLMRIMGAVHAMAFDGGGSATFVARGRVVNRPSDRLVRRGGRTRVVRYPSSGDRIVRQWVERRVATALVVMPN